ncbi:hypothetical protein SAMN05216268_12151 [Streptomyces yunnanensis]|uniref:Transposase n=1 Tax=Streptomyces yunnanensis TaxID=156453 RepID=A0A9X8N6C8_9ACTN|nr:hypothetical protein [Streptomyces yunnanensis]SHN14581.1 hypothetical protein SAMN05216268_12151 [Streptomyces yunnanensis]
MTGRPPKGRTWGRRGITPTVRVCGRSRGRLSVAGLLCFNPGLPARLCYRLRRHAGRKGERRSLTLLRRRLKALQYRHGILGGFLAGTGLTLDRPES